MIIINYLSDILAEKIKISPSASRGLIKLSIKDQFDPFTDPYEVNYNQLKLAIQEALKERLIKLQIDNIDDLIDLLLSELKKNQSLITMNRF